MLGFAKIIFVAFAALTAVQALPSAVPQAQVEKRQIGSIFNDITSGAASVATHDVPGLITTATSVFGKATSAAGSIGNVITSNGAGIVEYLTSDAGRAFTVVTSVGGSGFTLATSGAGEVTTAFGSVYTVATAAALSHNAAPSFGVTSSLLVGFATVILSTLVGAMITL
ncbi:hypothetical protein AX14_001026 [Amanita brunnescens Koide BX004]|nr:hypothetical protein AX14_001026 [Amanita brunnescens Koide BX004]